ncbi:MAG: hypothetical protein M3146_00630 [Thermoproteota archaeon]|nr:hypothetical protein [Thermoproteota archaeon]
MTLFSAVVMTILSIGLITEVWYEPNINVQAQIIEDDKPETLSSGTPPTVGTMPTIKITSHISGQQVKTGPLTISGTSSDTSATNCQVYADWNDNMPFGKAVAAGPGGPDDYSKWTFTYGNDYHPIKNGTNNLTSKISCDDGSTPLTKWSSINLVGVNSSDPGSVISQAITSGNPSPSLPVGLALPAPNQPIATSSPLDPIVGEEDEDRESDENDENDDSDSTENNSDDDNENADNEDDGDSGNNDDDGDDDDGDDDDGDDDDGDDDGPVNFGPDGPVD